MFGINPLTLYAAAGSMLIGISAGWTVRDWRCDAAAASAMIKAEKAIKRAESERDRISQDYESFRAGIPDQAVSTRNTIREIYRDKIVNPDCAADPNFVRLLQAASDRANSAATGKPSPTMRPDPESAQPAN